jgi:hypothetical protein
MAKTRNAGPSGAPKASTHKITSNWEGSHTTIADLRALTNVGLLPKEE